MSVCATPPSALSHRAALSRFRSGGSSWQQQRPQAMSLFGRILPIGDALARVTQFAAQVVKLESEEEEAKGSSHQRSNYRRRCSELFKQLEDQEKRISGSREKDQSGKKEEALERIAEYKTRVSRLNDREDSRASRDSNSDVPARVTNTEPEEEEETVDSVDREEADWQLGDQGPSRGMYAAGSGSESDGSARPAATPKPPRATVPAPQPRTVGGARGGGAAAKRQQSMYESEGTDDEDSTPPTPAARKTVQKPAPVRIPSSAELAAATPSVTTPPATTPPLAPAVVVEGDVFEVLADFAGETDGDLSITKGERITVTATRPDGWWQAMSSGGVRGLVPKTYLRQWRPPPAPAPARLDEGDRTDVMRELEEQRPVQLEPGHPLLQQRAPSPIIMPQMPVERPSTANLLTCLGDALSSDRHLTYACHLTPRLSESNLGFHDLYWNFDDDKLRKRRVRVSRLIRLVRLEGMPREQFACGLVRAALFDESRSTGRQIVSNVHTIRAQIKGGTWTFITKTDGAHSGSEYCDFIVRSNYRQAQVVLLLEASVIIPAQDGSGSERSLGIVRLPLLNDAGNCRLVNKSFSETLYVENIFDQAVIKRDKVATKQKLVMRVLDIPERILHFVDSLPDVLLFNPMYARLAFYYRRRAGTVLIRDRDNAMSAELISDPLLACFPHVADQPDLLDLLRKVWITKKAVNKRAENEQTAAFFEVFCDVCVSLYRLPLMPPYSIWDTQAIQGRQAVFTKALESIRSHRSPAVFLSTHPCRPLNIFELSFDLTGPHAID